MQKQDLHQHASVAFALTVAFLTSGALAFSPSTPVDYSADLTITNCTDSDKGRQVYIQGTASVDDVSQTDSCDSGGKLHEWYCKNGQVTKDITTCPVGFACSNGACVAVVQELKTAENVGTTSCSDSDGGKDLRIAGKVTKDTDFQDATLPDTCLSGRVIKEFYCYGGAPKTMVAKCPMGTMCREGACVKSGR